MKTLTAHIEEYIEWRQSLRMSDETIAADRYRLNGFVRWLKRTYMVMTADELRKDRLQAWQKHLADLTDACGRPQNARTLNNKIATVKGFLKRLAQDGYVLSGLESALCYVKTPRLLPGGVLTHAQVRKLLNRVPTSNPEGFRNRAMLELLYSSGLRCAELLGLDLEDLDFRNGAIRVMGKGRKQRVAPIGRTATRYLDSYVKAVRPYLVRDRSQQAVFLDGKGGRVAAERLRSAIRAAAHRAGIESHVSPHTFRRSCATELIRGGANMYHVKELLGHESLDTLKHYARLTILDLKRTHEKCHPRERDESAET